MTRISPTLTPFRVLTETADYVAALIREGDNFDYYTWLQRVREEEARAKQRSVTCASHELVVAETDNQTCKSDGIWPNAQLVTRAVPIPRALRQAHRACKSKSSQIGIQRRLEKVSDAWDDFHSSRARDAVYGYLRAVFETVMHYKMRRRTKKLLRHAFEFAELLPLTRMRIYSQPSFVARVTIRR